MEGEHGSATAAVVVTDPELTWAKSASRLTSMREILQEREARDWLDAAKQVLPGGVLGTSTMPADVAVVPIDADGCRVRSADGREYIDYTMGSGVLLHGYRPAHVLAAAREQQDRIEHFFGYLNQPAIELAEEIVALVPSAEMVRFAASGGEATFYAMRLARAATGRSKILKFEGGYHGFHDYAIHSFSRGATEPFPTPEPNSAGIPAAVTNEVLVAPFNDAEVTESVVRAHAGELAAIIVEPIQRIIEPQEGFLERLRALADEIGACLIFDEVVTGFRIGLGGAQERYGVMPDITTLGKIVGGGLPLAAVCGRRDLIVRCAPWHPDHFAYQSGTMNGNPVAAASGLAMVRDLREAPPYSRLAEIGDQLRTQLTALLYDHGERAQVVGSDSLWQVVFTDQPITSVRDIWQSDGERLLRFHDGLLRNGVLVWRGNRSFISTAHDDEAIAITLEAADAALRGLSKPK